MGGEERSFLKALGPGLLWAGAAVGVSHLVQSTRAGASFGLGLVVVVLAANFFKYPAFQFGPRYAAATGTSLLEGYRRQGRWALVLYAVLPFTVDVVSGVGLVPPKDFLGSWENFARVGIGRMVVHLLPAGAFFVLAVVEDAA